MPLEEIGKKLTNRKNLARLPNLAAGSVPSLLEGVKATLSSWDLQRREGRIGKDHT